MQFRILGPVEVYGHDKRLYRPSRRQERCLLGILLMETGKVVQNERLCRLLWEEPPDHALTALRSMASRLRALLAEAGGGADAPELLASRGGYSLSVPPMDIDLHQARHLLDAASRSTELTEREGLLRDALGLWRGPALLHAADEALRERICIEVDEMHLYATEESIAVGMELGRHRELLPQLSRLVAEHPLRERLVCHYILALHKSGRTPEALEVYTRTRQRLSDQLGLSPSREMQQLHTAILREHDSAEPTSSARDRTHFDSAVPAQLPPDIASFSGRREAVGELDALLSRREARATAVVISAIAGAAGVGKTALAVHWAHRVADRFPDGQLYLNLRGYAPGATPMTPADAVRGMLDALNVPRDRMPETLEARVALYRSLLAGKRVLVLLDNARDSDQVRPLLPGAPGCCVLVTSRDQLHSLVAAEGAQPITLDLLSQQEARDLLVARLGIRRVVSATVAVDEIIHLCARLPLALSIVGARAAINPHIPLEHHAELLRQSSHRLDSLASEDIKTDIRSVFSWSYQALSEPAARQFRLLGLCAGPDISVAAAASLAAVSLPQARDLLAELLRANMVVENAPGRFTCHDLLRAYAAELLRDTDPPAGRQDALVRLFDHYLHTAHEASAKVYPTSYPIAPQPPADGVTPEDMPNGSDAHAWFRKDYRVLLDTIDHAAAQGFYTHAWQLAWALSHLHFNEGHWDDWFAVQHRALTAGQQRADTHGQARIHNRLGLAHAYRGDVEDGRRHQDAALTLFTTLGDLRGQALSQHGFAALHSGQQRHRESIEHEQLSLRLYQAAGDNAAEAMALNNIGYSYIELGEYGEALEHCTRSVHLFEQLDFPWGLASALDSLGYTLYHLDDYPQAISYCLRALEIFNNIGDRYVRSEVLTHLGDAYRKQAEPRAAVTAWRDAMEMLLETGRDVEHLRVRLSKVGSQHLLDV